MSVDKGTESLPVSNFGFSSRGAIDLSSIVIGGRFVLQPLVDGVATKGGDTHWLRSFFSQRVRYPILWFAQHTPQQRLSPGLTYCTNEKNLWIVASRGFQPLMISDPLTEIRSGGGKNQAQSAENSTCHLLFSVNA